MANFFDQFDQPSGDKNFFDQFDEPTTKRDTGFTGALKSTVERMKGESALTAGKVGLMEEKAAEEYAAQQEAKARRMFQPTEEGWTQAPVTKFKELLGGSLPYVAAPLAAAGAGAAAAAAFPAVATIGGIGAATLAGVGAGTAQYVGTGLSRQMETGKSLADTSLLNAGAAAFGEALLDRASFGVMSGVRNIFKTAGKEVGEDVIKEVAKKGIMASAGDLALAGFKGAAAEGATEAAQQFLERLQAGLSLTDKAARDEYFDNFIGGAVLGGTLAAPGHVTEKMFAPKPTAGAGAPEEEVRPPKVTDVYPTAEPVTSAGLAPIEPTAAPIPTEAPIAPVAPAPSVTPIPAAEAAPVAAPEAVAPVAETQQPAEIPHPFQAELNTLYKDRNQLLKAKDNLNLYLRKVGINPKEKADMGIEKNNKSYPGVFREAALGLDVLMHDAIENGIITEADLARYPDPVEGFRQMAKAAIDGAVADTPQNMANMAELEAIQGRIEKLESIPKEEYGRQAEAAPEEAIPEFIAPEPATSVGPVTPGEYAYREPVTPSTNLSPEGEAMFSRGTAEQQKAVDAVVEKHRTLFPHAEAVYQNGDLSLVKTVDPRTGDFIYAPAKQDKFPTYPRDIASAEGQKQLAALGLSQAEQADLMAQRNKFEAAEQAKHEKTPFLKIGQGVTASNDVNKNILAVSKSWANLLGIKKNVYITTVEDAVKNRENYTGPHRVIGTLGVRGSNGVMKQMDDGNYVVVLKKSSSMSKNLETIAHEFGHIHEKEVYDTAAPETKEAIQKAFREWRSKLSSKTPAKELVESLRAKTSAQTTTMPEGLLAGQMKDVDAYWTSFREWYADQVSRWAVSSDKPLTVVDKFFAKLASALRKFYQTVKGQKYLPNETFKQYLDNIASRMQFESFAEAKAPKGQMALFSQGKVEPEGKLSNAPPKLFTKLTKQQDAGEKLQTINANIRNAWNDDKFWTKLRNEWIDPSSGLTKSLQSLPVFDTNGQLRADMLNHSQAQSINLIKNGLLTGMPVLNKDGSIIIDASENNLARSQTIADSIDNNAFVKSSGLSGRAYIAAIARAMRGKEIMEEDAARRKLGVQQLKEAKDAIKAAQTARDEGKSIGEIRGHLNRAKDLRKQGYENKSMNRELQIKQDSIDWAEKQLNNVPEVKQVLDIWKNVNDSLVKLWQSVGLLTEQQADNYLSKKSYVPLFKSREDLSDQPTGFGGTGLKTAKEIKRLKGALDERNIWENVEKHYASMVASAYQNQTRKVGSEQLKSLGLAEVIDGKSAKDLEANKDAINLRYRDPSNEFADNQGIVSVIIEHPNDLAAFQMMHYELGPIMKGFAAANQVLRAGALLNPMFWIKQLIRDPVHATLVTDSGIVTPFHAAKGYIDVLRGDSREANILARAGVIGQMDSTIDIHDFLKQVGMEKKAPTMLDKALHKAMKFHEASDAATRVALFKDQEKKALAMGMSKEDAVNYAVFKARESINFAIHGSSPTLNALRNMIPFLSASVNSLDTVYRAATGYGLPPAEKKAAQMLFVKRAVMMSLMATAYAMLYQGDEDYKKLPDYTKDNNFLMPNPFGDGHTFIKVPVPFEVGFLFKTIPEATVRYMAGNSTGKEVLASYLSGVTNTIPGNAVPLPQAFKPAFEVITNHSFFTHRPIESVGEQNLPTAMRGARASEVAKQLSSLGLDKVGLSPAKIDYLIQGYTAELGAFSMNMASSAVDLATGKERTAKNIEEMPFFKSFMTNPKASKAIADFYDLAHTAQETVNEFNQYKKFGEGEKIKELMANEENRKLIAAAPALRGIQSQMTNLRTQMKLIDQNQNMPPEARRERLNQLQTVYENLAMQGDKLATAMKLER